MHTEARQSDTNPRNSEIKSDWRRVALLVAGLVFALAGFIRYTADIAAILS